MNVNLCSVLYRVFLRVKFIGCSLFGQLQLKFILKANSVQYEKSIKSNGIPIIRSKGMISIGRNFKMNNNFTANLIGRQQPCMLIVQKGGVLEIGDNVGLSSTAIVCAKKVTIEDAVKMGGNVVIYDSDFHSLNYSERTSIPENKANIKVAPVHIKKNVFIGAHSTILKGVTIGENSVIGACSVVRTSISANEIWAGNPAVFLKKNV